MCVREAGGRARHGMRRRWKDRGMRDAERDGQRRESDGGRVGGPNS